VTLPDWQQKVRADYLASFPKKLETIESLAAEWFDSPQDVTRFESLRTAVHRIHGTAGSYGFEALGAIMAEWDDLMTAALKDGTHAGGVTIDSVRQHLAAFRAEIANSIARESGG
jgi:chemotaxis protein histidine kinase CheA